MCVCVVYVNVAPNSFGWDEFVVVVVYECTFTVLYNIIPV